MFQYAAARSLAFRWRRDVLVDLRTFKADRLRQAALFRWRVRTKPASPARLSVHSEIALKAARRLSRHHTLRRLYFEQSMRHDPAFGVTSRPWYIEGYFQSEKYFSGVREALISEFRPVENISGKNAELEQRMLSCESVSLHVRRTDYVTVKENVERHGHCGLDYYARASAFLNDACGDLAWFVFSDDLAWCRENLRLPGRCIYVDGNSGRPEIDLYLMSRCKYNICANSSFSWWGAWLNSNPGKIVVAPAKWFSSPDLDSVDIVPHSWNRL